MSGVFDGIRFYIIPETAQRLKDTNKTMVSLLTQGSAVESSALSDDVTHVICTSADFKEIYQKARDSSFSCFVTPKWVFISQSVQYCVPFVIIQFCLVLYCRITILPIRFIFSLDSSFSFIILRISRGRSMYPCLFTVVPKFDHLPSLTLDTKEYFRSMYSYYYV